MLTISKKKFNSFPALAEDVSDYLEQNTFIRQPERKTILTYTALAILWIMQKLSWRTAFNLGTFLGTILYRIKVRRDIAMTNLDIVFGKSKTPTEKDEIYKKSMQNFGRVIINYFRLPFQGESFWENNCRIENEKALKKAMNKKKVYSF